jgi:hypothetical protein
MDGLHIGGRVAVELIQGRELRCCLSLLGTSHAHVNDGGRRFAVKHMNAFVLPPIADLPCALDSLSWVISRKRCRSIRVHFWGNSCPLWCVSKAAAAGTKLADARVCSFRQSRVTPQTPSRGRHYRTQGSIGCSCCTQPRCVARSTREAPRNRF